MCQLLPTLVEEVEPSVASQRRKHMGRVRRSEKGPSGQRAPEVQSLREHRASCLLAGVGRKGGLGLLPTQLKVQCLHQIIPQRKPVWFSLTVPWRCYFGTDPGDTGLTAAEVPPWTTASWPPLLNTTHSRACRTSRGKSQHEVWEVLGQEKLEPQIIRALGRSLVCKTPLQPETVKTELDGGGCLGDQVLLQKALKGSLGVQSLHF